MGVISCNEGVEGFIKDLNEQPQIAFVNNPDVSILMDSIKVLLSSSNPLDYYSIKLIVSDPDSNIVSLTFLQKRGIGIFIQNGDTLVDKKINLENTILSIRYYPKNVGSHSFEFEVKDKFGLTNNAKIDLVVFENLDPIAEMEISKIGALSPFQYRIDGSGSYDKDFRFGGGIIEYEYSFIGKTFNVVFSEIEYVFPSAGLYVISLRVKDNNGAWSESIQKSVTIN